MPGNLNNATALTALGLDLDDDTAAPARTALRLGPAHTGVYNVRHYGAAGDGATDDTAAIDAAVAALNAGGGGTLLLPRGKYNTAGGHVITAPCVVAGQGQGYFHDDGAGSYYYLGTASSLVRVTSATAYCFTFTTPYAEAQDLTVHCVAATAPTAGGAFRCQSDGSAAAMSSRYQFRNVTILDGWYGIEHANGAFSVFLNVSFVGQRRYMLYLRDDTNADWGDYCVTNCFFTENAGHDTAAAVKWESGGGLKILNSKFVGTRLYHGVWVHFDDKNSSQLLVSNCSLDTISGNALRMEVSGTATFSDVVISGNYIATVGPDYEPIYLSRAAGSTGGLSNVFIGDGIIKNVEAAGKACITLDGGVGVILGTIHWGGVATALVSAGATDTAWGGWQALEGNVYVTENTVHTTGANAGLWVGARNGDSGYLWLSDSNAAGVRLYSFALAGDVFKVDGSRNATCYGTLAAPHLDLGDGYGGTPGAAADLKLYVYNDGTNKYGLGLSPGLMEYQVPTGAAHAFYVNGAEKYRVNATGHGFNGATPVGKATLSAAATDAATTQALVNQIRTALINLGLAQ